MATVTKLASKKKRINEITDLLTKGWERKAILKRIKKTYKISDSTIDNEIRLAKVEAEKRIAAAEELRQSEADKATLEAVKEGLLSDLELEMILCRMAGGNVQVQEWVRGAPVLRDISPNEITNAVDKIWKKRGSYPEVAIKLKGDKENPLFDLSKLPVKFE